MLHEIVGVADEPPTRRRWFHDDYFDLFVWQTLEGEVTQFQLCYGIDSSERALVWHRQGGFFHDGTGIRDERRATEEVMARFADAAPTLPKLVRQTVDARLQEYAKRTEEGKTRRTTFRRAAWQKRLSRSTGAGTQPGKASRP
jgi:hypothetical protein